MVTYMTNLPKYSITSSISPPLTEADGETNHTAICDIWTTDEWGKYSKNGKTATYSLTADVSGYATLTGWLWAQKTKQTKYYQTDLEEAFKKNGAVQVSLW